VGAGEGVTFDCLDWMQTFAATLERGGIEVEDPLEIARTGQSRANLSEMAHRLDVDAIVSIDRLDIERRLTDVPSAFEIGYQHSRASGEARGEPRRLRPLARESLRQAVIERAEHPDAWARDAKVIEVGSVIQVIRPNEERPTRRIWQEDVRIDGHERYTYYFLFRGHGEYWRPHTPIAMSSNLSSAERRALDRAASEPLDVAAAKRQYAAQLATALMDDKACAGGEGGGA
jgi:hypothetical protein